MLLNCDVIVIFMICSQLGAIRMLVSRKLKFSLKMICYLIKTENRTKKFLTQVVFLSKMLIFCKKMLTSAKLRGLGTKKRIF